MTRHQHLFMPYLLDLLKHFLSPIRASIRKNKRKKDPFRLAQEQDLRHHLIVFLQNFIAQTLKHEFDLDPRDFKDFKFAYQALQKRLHKKAWTRKANKSRAALGKAISAILSDWSDIVGTGYVIDEKIYPVLIKSLMPKLLSTTLTYAEEIDDRQLVKRLNAIISSWTEVFSEKRLS